MSIRILCHSKLFRIPDKSRSSPLLDDYWEWVAEEFVKQYPADSLQLAELMLAHFGQKKTVIAGYHSNSHKVLSDIARPLPAEVWLIVAKNMTDIHTSKAFAISDWLRGGEFHQAQNGAICLFDLNHVWKWIDEDKANRAPHAAGFVPPRLFRDPAQICVARELLIRYGDLEDVRDALHANFGTESFVGSGSLHYKTKRDQFSVLKEAEDNQNVLRWLDDEITSLDASIREHRIFEESRGF